MKLFLPLQKFTEARSPENSGIGNEYLLGAFKAAKQPQLVGEDWILRNLRIASETLDMVIQMRKKDQIEQPNHYWEILKWTCVKEKCPLDYPIHSVKRLSDGEVFTVGERRLDKNRGCFHITAFEIVGNQMWVTGPDGSQIGLDRMLCRKDEPGQMPSALEWQVLSWQEDSDGSYIKREGGERMIKAVRRLSDDQVFSVGDFVSLHGKQTVNNITGFSRGGDRLLLLFDGWGSQYLEDVQLQQTTYRKSDLPPAIEREWLTKENQEFLAQMGPGKVAMFKNQHEMPSAANGNVPVWLTPEDVERLEMVLHLQKVTEAKPFGDRPHPAFLSPRSIEKLGRILALFIDPMAGAVHPEGQAPDSAGPDLERFARQEAKG